MATWARSVLPLLFVAAIIAFEEWISVPSCETTGTPRGDDAEDPDDLKVMMIADLLLLGPDGGFADVFRNSYTAKFLRKSFEKLKPDMLLVLGDISVKGSNLTMSKWKGLLHQFQKMLGPFVGLPLHIILGDRDIGECGHMDVDFISQVANNFPGLDSAGCGAFEISNISFISLNAVAMLCGHDEIRFQVERAIERESLDLRDRTKGIKEADNNMYEQVATSIDLNWRENHASSGSGPVLLLHIPLHQTGEGYAERNTVGQHILLNHHVSRETLRELEKSEDIQSAPCELTRSLPMNATEYIFQSLRPRIIFSAHSHRYLDHTHRDGTHEVTVPGMTWAARDDPGFVVVTFGQNKSVIVRQCFLARESHVLMIYLSISCILLATVISMSR